MAIRKARSHQSVISKSASFWKLLCDLEDASEAGKHRPIAHHFRISRAMALRQLPGVRVASDMVAPPTVPRELLDFKPASWELPDSPQ